jgi:hypothetical protein
MSYLYVESVKIPFSLFREVKTYFEIKECPSIINLSNYYFYFLFLLKNIDGGLALFPPFTGCLDLVHNRLLLRLRISLAAFRFLSKYGFLLFSPKGLV